MKTHNPGALRHSKTHRSKQLLRGPRFSDYVVTVDHDGMRQLDRGRTPFERTYLHGANLVAKRLYELLPSGSQLLDAVSLDFGRAMEVKVRLPNRAGAFMRMEKWFRLRPLR